jgi:hypothetical protein
MCAITRLRYLLSKGIKMMREMQGHSRGLYHSIYVMHQGIQNPIITVEINVCST